MILLSNNTVYAFRFNFLWFNLDFILTGGVAKTRVLKYLSCTQIRDLNVGRADLNNDASNQTLLSRN